jgi:Tfp pilus assembly protein PilE
VVVAVLLVEIVVVVAVISVVTATNSYQFEKDVYLPQILK